MSLETEIGQLRKQSKVKRKFELLLQRDVISAPQGTSDNPQCKGRS